MKAVMVMFDSLNRHFLPPYGCDWTFAPNFKRLAEHTVTFDRSYVCSMPCMPARRELHTARPNFLHCGWGPLEPFDDSMPEMLKKHGVYTHLATDHYHYFEDGGATYHGRYNTWEFFRGQEGDLWQGQVADPDIPACVNPRSHTHWRQDWINRSFMKAEHQQPQPQTMAAGVDFLRRNHRQDNWFLQIETFDPHEPYFTQRKYKDLYAKHYEAYYKAAGKHFDWPNYEQVHESPAEVEHARTEYAALLSMCDAYLGEVLDTMDELDLWKDTMLTVWTDHGFLLGEHNCWAKCWMPFYEEIAHTPFFVWDPRSKKKAARCDALVQPALDLGPTLLGLFGLSAAKDMLGHDLAATLAHGSPVREAALFGIHGGQVNVTDGRYVYMRAAKREDNQPINDYTLMPADMRSLVPTDRLRADKVTLAGPFTFTKGCKVLRIPAGQPWGAGKNSGIERTMLFDLASDPQQQKSLHDPAVEKRMIGLLMRLMKEADAPAEQFERLGL